MTHQQGCARLHDDGDQCATTAIPLGTGSVWVTWDETGPLAVVEAGDGPLADTRAGMQRFLDDTAPIDIPAPRSPGTGLPGAVGLVIAAATVAAFHAPALAAALT